MTSTTRAAIYIRVSTSAQEDEGTSLDTQEVRCRAYADEHDYQIADVYRDVFTGAQYRERPGLSALREQVRAGAVDVVLAYALDRLSRNQAHLAILAEEAEDHGARLAFVTEDFEDSAVGRFIRSAKGFAAEIEREKIGERTVRGRLARIQSGKLLAGPRPLYGYRWRSEERGAYDVDPVTGPVVRRIFGEAVSGTPLRTIARRLSEAGIPTPRGGAVWYATSVHGILRHPSYSGTAHAWAWRATGETTTRSFDAEQAIPLPEGTIPPLVDQTAWAAVQERLARNKLESRRNASDPEGSLLRAGIARCGYCAGAMRVKGRTPAYVCHAASNPQGRRCRGHSINVAYLDGKVWERVRSILSDPEVLREQLDRMRAADSTESDLAPIARALADVERQQSNLARSIATTDNPDVAGVLSAELAALTTRKRDIELERAAVETQRATWEAVADRLDDIGRWCGTVASRLDELSYADRRNALVALGVEVKVWGLGAAQGRWVMSAELPIPLPVRAHSVSDTTCSSCPAASARSGSPSSARSLPPHRSPG